MLSEAARRLMPVTSSVGSAPLRMTLKNETSSKNKMSEGDSLISLRAGVKPKDRERLFDECHTFGVDTNAINTQGIGVGAGGEA